MLIKSFDLPSGARVNIPRRSDNGNRLTMLLGVNGTQKSTLLRGFLDTALEQISASAFSPLKGLLQVTYDRPPAAIIALSAIPNDRFPTKSRTSLRVRTRYEVEEYEYIGPRHNQNIISRNQSLGALVSAALTNRYRSPSVTRFIGQMSVRTAIPAQFAICLRQDMVMGKRGSVLEEFLKDEHPSHTKRMDLAFLHSHGLMEEFRRMFEPGNQKSLIVEIDLLTGKCSPEIPFIDIAIRHKLLQVRRSNARAERLINPEDYSAGQWGLFSSLVTLALKVKDDALVLIDEPESALHPSWQRDYVDCLSQAMADVSGCHVLLATHSPLLCGSAGSFSSELIVLRRHPDTGALFAEFEEIPEGWQSNDILEQKFELHSTRGSAFVGKMDNLLKLVAQGIEVNAKTIKKLLKEVEPTVIKLPDGDPVRSIFVSMQRLVSKG
ncbi:AAA family ATPase [Pseudomonas viciae]|uniref:AAA family ATPase n=1 Tax=Pseudomonas viciae TaxID=2505979 RepID=UPI0022344BC5|nr:AAA family ATPase [Pseudomonas viciae]UZE84003.1 AAA family ATPase [Pseudomonas viciae]